MAENQSSTPTSANQVVALTTPRKALETALYECGVITTVLDNLSTLMISTTEEVCGTAFDFLAQLLNERHNKIEELIRCASFRGES